MNFAYKTKRNPNFQLSAIKAIELEAASRSGIISLAQGIPSFQTPKVVTNFVREKIEEGLCDRYSLTNGLPELREEISLSLRSEQLHYDPDDEILVTAGSIEAITAALLGLTSPGDEVIVPSPSYVSYAACIRLAGCEPRFVKLDEDQHFDLSIDDIERAINRKTRVIFYCNPNNPTGTVYSEEKTIELVKLAREHDLVILTDEVYKDFYYTHQKHSSPVFLPDTREQVVRVFSFSKAYAMTGWRVGYLHADRSLVRRIIGYHDAMVTCAPVASQYAALAALRFAAQDIERFRAEYLVRRNVLLERLDLLSHVLDYQTPQAAYFAFPRIKDSVPLARQSNELAYDILDKVGLALVPGIAFGPSGESHLRISFGRELAHVEQGMDRLLDYFSKTSQHTAGSSGTLAASPTSPNPTKTPLLRRVAERVLGWAARTYIRRSRVQIVGICGTRGKTVCKRIVSELLRNSIDHRTSLLSYNTSIGLPLSVLGLESPLSTRQKLFFPLQVLSRALLAKEDARLLILEYGLRSRADAEKLCRIACPDWLIISHISGQDLSLDYRAIQDGVRHLIDQTDRERIIWYGDDPLTAELGPKLKAELSISDQQCSEGQVRVNGTEIHLNGDLPGQSYRLALVAALTLASRLGLSHSEIQGALESDPSLSS